jgi:mono/diheme cytochrome c family protein
MNWLVRLKRERPLLLGAMGGIAVCGVIGALAGVFLIMGGYNTAASSPHAKIIAWAAHTTMTNSVKRRAPDLPEPRTVSHETLVSGALLYEQNCVACHGGPGVPRAPWASAVLPTPPYLLDSNRKWTRGQLFEIIDHGVKLTAMPAWGEVLPHDQVMALVDFVEQLPRLKPAQFADLRQAALAQAGTQAPASQTPPQSIDRR